MWGLENQTIFAQKCDFSPEGCVYPQFFASYPHFYAFFTRSPAFQLPHIWVSIDHVTANPTAEQYFFRINVTLDLDQGLDYYLIR